jgi:Tfp pilus assembly protein PilN
MKPVRINLATRPLRNTKFFLFVSAGLGLVSLITVLLAVVVFSRFALKIKGASSELARLEQSIKTAQREKTRFQNKTEEATKRYQDTINFANAIILQKSFSWAEFLSRLEDALPDSSYILSLAPVAVESSRVQVRLKVASPNLDEQVALINKLLELNFSQIRVEGEDLDERGQLTSDIVVTYERHV